MIRIIEHMPAGTIGVEASGKITEADYRDVLVPTVDSGPRRTGDVRLLYVLDEGAEYSAGAMWADYQAVDQAPEELVAGSPSCRTPNGWSAASSAFGWMMPGEIKVFEPGGVDEAKEWLVG